MSNDCTLKTLLESIPVEHRPALDTAMADQSIGAIGNPMRSIGTTFIPVIFTDAQTGESIRVVLYAIVVPSLFMGMFIGMSVNFFKSQSWGDGTVMHTFDFGRGKERKIRGII